VTELACSGWACHHEVRRASIDIVRTAWRKRLHKAVTTIGRDAEEDEGEAENDENGRQVDRLLLLAHARPPEHAARHRHQDPEAAPLALLPHGATIACEEAEEKDERADEVVADRDRTTHAGAEGEPDDERDDSRSACNADEEDRKAAKRRDDHAGSGSGSRVGRRLLRRI